MGLNATEVPNIAILDLCKAISRKRCKIEGKFVLITNRKSYMGFRLVPKSVSFNDLERRNGPYFAFFSPNSVASRAYCLKVVEDIPQIFCDRNVAQSI